MPSDFFQTTAKKRLGIYLILLIVLCCGCGKNSSDKEAQKQGSRSNKPQIYQTKASGKTVYQNKNSVLDVSNNTKGYVMLNYHGTNKKVKFLIDGPDGVESTFLVTKYNKPVAYPLTGGNGTYKFMIYESVDIKNNRYIIAFSKKMNIKMTDPFLPFLTPNVYASYTAKSAAVEKGKELAKGCDTDLDVINNVYHYISDNITYDEEKAKKAYWGYIPDPDDTMATKSGICFDYASLMTTMLRSQRIPTKLEVGYSGDIYHAWISCYTKEQGWIDKVIEIKGSTWTLVDPTLAANSDRDGVKDYIGDGSKYTVDYVY